MTSQRKKYFVAELDKYYYSNDYLALLKKVEAYLQSKTHRELVVLAAAYFISGNIEVDDTTDISVAEKV